MSCYAQRLLIDIILILRCKKSAWRWSSKRSFVHGVGVQSEALYMALEFKAKLCTCSPYKLIEVVIFGGQAGDS
jgi:hypothetical protein